MPSITGLGEGVKLRVPSGATGACSPQPADARTQAAKTARIVVLWCDRCRLRVMVSTSSAPTEVTPTLDRSRESVERNYPPRPSPSTAPADAMAFCHVAVRRAVPYEVAVAVGDGVPLPDGDGECVSVSGPSVSHSDSDPEGDGVTDGPLSSGCPDVEGDGVPDGSSSGCPDS